MEAILCTYKFLLEVVRVNKSILGAEEDVLDEFLVGERRHLVVGEDGVISYKGRINPTRIDPLGLGSSPTAAPGPGVGVHRPGHHHLGQEGQHQEEDKRL